MAGHPKTRGPNPLGAAPVSGLLVRFAVPAILSAPQEADRDT